MQLSNETNELFAAFSMFQGELDNASKGKSGHGYKYADLAECINTAKPFLAKNGLAVTQLLGTNEEGKTILTTMLTHKSGQYMSETLVLVEAKLQGGGGKNPVQELGSAITYQRRYSYASIIGLAQEDDDAASLTRKEENKRRASFNPDECLASFTGAASSSNLEMLKALFGQCWKDLKGYPQQAKAKEIYDIRVQELTPEA